MLFPLLCQSDAVLAYYFHGNQESLYLKSSGKNDDINVSLYAAGTCNSCFIYRLDTLRYDFEIGSVERFEVVRVKYSTLAT
jgi:hypothetical protein